MLGFGSIGSEQCLQQSLTLTSFRHPNQDYPAILVSELDVDSLDKQSQALLQGLIKPIETQSLLGTRPWSSLCSSDYHQLENTSPFAAWFSLFGLTASFWSVDINQLDRQSDMPKLIKLLIEEGYPLSNNNGLISGSPEALMEQVATLPDQIEFSFADGLRKKVPSGCYCFSLRYKTPAGKLYNGLHPVSE